MPHLKFLFDAHKAKTSLPHNRNESVWDATQTQFARCFFIVSVGIWKIQ